VGLFALKISRIDPRFRAIRLAICALVHFAQTYPNTSASVTNVDDEQDECAERSEIVLPLLRVLLQETLKHQLDWLGKSQEMDKSEEFHPVEIWTFLENDQFWDGGYNVEDEIAREVTNGDLLEVLMSSGLLDKVQSNLEDLEDIDDHLNILHSYILFLCFLVIIHIWEDQYEWRDNHIVNDKQGDPEIPHMAESALCIDEVPLQSVFVLADLVILIDVFIDIVNHHLLKVGLSHLLQSCLETELIVVTSSFRPEILDSLLLLILGHFGPFFLWATMFLAGIVSSAEAHQFSKATFLAILVLFLAAS